MVVPDQAMVHPAGANMYDANGQAMLDMNG
jgi:hypothetical protein